MLPTGSIKWRLQAWHGAVLCAVTATLLVAYHRSERREAIGRIDREHRLILMVAAPELRAPRGPAGPPPRASDFGPSSADDLSDLGRSGPARVPLLREFIRGGGFIAHRAPGRPIRVAMGETRADVEDFVREVEPTSRDATFSQDGYRVLAHLLRGGDVVVIGTSLESTDASMRTLGWKLAAAGVATVLCGVAAGAWIIARALRPVETIAATARRLAAGTLSERVPVPSGGGELATLAGVLNECFDRVEKAFRQQARFTADASHELRTPLSVMLTESQLALKRERTGEEYREALTICAETAGRMRRLVEDLLLLARADAQATQLQRESCDLGEIAERACRFLGALAEERGVTLTLQRSAASCLGDAGQLERIVINLAMNALQHAPAGTEVRVETANSPEGSRLAVVDHGPGIRAEDLPSLFQRFYRTDTARSRESGGTGLGLAISRCIAEAHGGTIRAESEPGVRTVFTLELPAV